MNELKNNYAELDYSQFKAEDLRFQSMAEQGRQAASGKRDSDHELRRPRIRDVCPPTAA